MSAVVYAPSTVIALTQMIKTRVRTYHIVQPDRITPGHMYIAQYMSHVPVVGHNRHTQQGYTSRLPAQSVNNSINIKYKLKKNIQGISKVERLRDDVEIFCTITKSIMYDLFHIFLFWWTENSICFSACCLA